MSVNDDTLDTLTAMRLRVAAEVDGVTQDLALAWARAWNEVAREWEDAIADLVSASKDGAWPTPRQVRRARRALAARDTTRELLLQLRDMIPARVVVTLPALLDDVTEYQRLLAATQYPPTAGGATYVAATLDRVDPDALTAIVDRTAGQVTARSLPLASQADAAMRSVLVKGIALGVNPNRAAAEMLARVEGAFNGGLHRARIIARTEMLDAHRAASRAQQDRMRDTLTGWQWIATLDRRTCPSCLAMHGSEHPLTVAGPLDHQQGRCDRLPVVKAWKDLGFDGIDEPPSVLPDARAWFDSLPAEQRVAIMGQDRLDLLDSGQIGWEDLAQRRRTDGWRPSYAPTPVKDLKAAATAAAA